MDLPVLEPQSADNGSPACDHESPGRWRPRRFWTWAHRLTAASFFALLVAIHQGAVPGVHGAPTAVTWFTAIPIVDPLAAAEVMLASRTATPSLLTGVAVTVALAVLLGRVFCGWLCPLGMALELGGVGRRWVRRGAARLGWKLPEGTAPASLKYWVLAVCLAVAVTASLPIFTAVSPINATVLGAARWPLLLLAVVGGVWLVELIWPRAFCRAVCPLGALYSLLSWKAFLRIRVVGAERLRCRQCVMHCPMGIDVMNDHVLAGKQAVDDPECTRCGVCTDVCRGEILQLSWRTRPITTAPKSYCDESGASVTGPTNPSGATSHPEASKGL